MRERLLLVGEDFGRSAEKYHSDVYALTGASGRHLAALAGLSGPMAVFEYALACERTNVVELPEHWRDRELVRAGVSRILPDMGGRRTILLGRRVRDAFGLSDLDSFEWRRGYAGGEVATMPHPSGRNRYWNDPDATAVAAAFFTAAVASV